MNRTLEEWLTILKRDSHTLINSDLIDLLVEALESAIAQRNVYLKEWANSMDRHRYIEVNDRMLAAILGRYLV